MAASKRRPICFATPIASIDIFEKSIGTRIFLMLRSFMLSTSPGQAAGCLPPFVKDGAFLAHRKTLRASPVLGSVHSVPGKRADVTKDVPHRRSHNDERRSCRAGLNASTT